MFSLFRKKKVFPLFNTLQHSGIRNQYFYRVASWTWLTEKQITVTDPGQPRMFTLDPWPEKIFLEAQGKLTVTEYVNQVAGDYKDEVPGQLDEIILKTIQMLLDVKLIQLSEVPVELDVAHNKAR